MASENWRDVDDFPNYLVSDDGRVKNRTTGRVLKACNDGYGYPQVILSNNGCKKSHRVHRLVAKAFLDYDRDDDSLEVNHRNGIKTDNVVSNLEWTTPSENMLHAFRTGLIRKPLLSASATRIRVIETGRVYNSESECARDLGINREGINACVNGRLNSYYKLHFERVV